MAVSLTMVTLLFDSLFAVLRETGAILFFIPRRTKVNDPGGRALFYAYGRGKSLFPSLKDLNGTSFHYCATDSFKCLATDVSCEWAATKSLSQARGKAAKRYPPPLLAVNLGYRENDWQVSTCVFQWKRIDLYS